MYEIYANTHVCVCKICYCTEFSFSYTVILGNGLASFIQIGLSQALASWFPPTPGTQAYVDSNINYYLYMLLGITIFGVILNIIPAVKNWVERLKDDALDATALDLTMNSDEFSSTSLGVENTINNMRWS